MEEIEIELRGAIREVMAHNAKRRFTEKSLRNGLETLGYSTEITEQVLLKAMEWNQVKGFITYIYNEEMERKEWSLTKDGQQREGVFSE